MYQDSEEFFNDNLNNYSYDPAKAVEVLEADGWTLDAEGNDYAGTCATRKSPLKKPATTR